MLSLVELRRAVEAVALRFADFRIEKLGQPDPFRIVLSCYGGADAEDRKRHLLISCDPLFGRVAELERASASRDKPPAFLQFLRPRLDGARIRSARLVGGDRQLALLLDAPDGSFELLLSLLGKRSNTYLLDGQQRVLAAQRPLEKTRRTLRIGEPWIDPDPGLARESEDRWPEQAVTDYLRTIEIAYDGSERQRGGDELSRRMAQALRKQRKSAERRLGRIESELAEAELASELQRHGELLKGVLGELRPGQSEVIVRDYATGDDVSVPLDPALSPKQNLEATFKRYQKLVRRLTKAGGQADAARESVAAIAALEVDLEAAVAQGTDSVTALCERDEAARLLRRYAPARRSEGALPERRKPRGPFSDVPKRLQPRRYLSADGLEIWVGRSDQGNDHLSTRLARSMDLFFHLDGAPGSHVVLRTGGRADPPSESVVDACELAVHFSKFKNSGRADVHLVPIKNVKKPKGAKPGLVYVTGGRTVHLRRESGRLERLLASRIED